MRNSRPLARICLDNIVHNYKLLEPLRGTLVPVVKSDAYGHGLERVAGVLAEAGAKALAVGGMEEVEDLRGLGFSGKVLSLLGPLDRDECVAASALDALCFVYRFEQLEWLSEQGSAAGRPVPVALKFDSGMARLGFCESDVPELVRRLEKLPGVRPVLAGTHLATADDPGAEEFVARQERRLGRILDALRKAGHDVAPTLSNSAAVMTRPGLDGDWGRPGIALYGGNPFWGTSRAGEAGQLRQAMEVSARVLQVHDLQKGRGISYGLTFTAPRDMRVAVVSAGYADCYSRGLTNAGTMCLGGHRVPIVGRVCMQLTAVDVSGVPDAAPGDEAYLLGGPGEGAVRAEELAQWWGTISYEIFCLLGRNRREYRLDSRGLGA